MSTAPAAPAATNVQTRTGTVHAGRRLADGSLVPACMGGRQISPYSGGIHLAQPTDAPTTCARCSGSGRGKADLTADEKAARKARRATERQAHDAAVRQQRIGSAEQRVARLADTEARMVARGGDPLLAELRADLAAERARLADLRG